MRPMAMASPTLFIWVVSSALAPGNFSNAKRGICRQHPSLGSCPSSPSIKMDVKRSLTCRTRRIPFKAIDACALHYLEGSPSCRDL